jgi:signal transduction histidine kinase
MPVFDIQTALMIIGALYVLLPITAWIVLAEQRSTQVVLWCAGGMLLGASLAFAGGNGDRMPDEVSRFTAGFGLLVANILRTQSLRLDLERPWPVKWMVLGAAAVSLIYVGIDIGMHNRLLRAEFFSLVLAVQLFYLAMLAWRIGRKEHSRNARMIAGIYAVVGWTLLFRLFTLASHTEFPVLAKEGLAVQLIAIATFLAAVVGHLSYVGLALDRATQGELHATATRVRREESHRLGEQIAQLDRQRNLGELSASLGHELNQPLTAILTNAQVAKRALDGRPLDARMQLELLEKIVANTKRASQIIDRIRSFIRPSVSRKVSVDLHHIVREVADLVADEAQRCQVSITLLPSEHPARAVADPLQISQIVLNALRNAMEALLKVVHREIQVSCSVSEGRAIVRIRDTGPGLAADAIARVGTPFFTTKPTGLGLGISISRSIAAQHGGTLTLKNADVRDGGGAIVELSLPALVERTL